jgi:DeoR/GlpR family transcriptional regulator of sugar metabolism
MAQEKEQTTKKYRVIKGGFIKLPKLVLLAKGLSRNAKALYALLLNYARENMECYPAQKTLAKELGVSVDTIRDDLNELKEFGLIVVKQSGLNRPNIYQIIELERVFKLFLEAEDSPHPEVEKKPIQDTEKTHVQEAAKNANKVEDKEVEATKKIYTTLRLDKELKQEKTNLFTHLEIPKITEDSFDVEAKYLAKELSDEKSIKFYQKVINRRNKGEITDTQIQKAFLEVKHMQSISKADNTKPLDKPGAMFNLRLKELVKADQAKKHQVDLASLTNSKKVEAEKPNFNELKNNALKSISMVGD